MAMTAQRPYHASPHSHSAPPLLPPASLLRRDDVASWPSLASDECGLVGGVAARGSLSMSGNSPLRWLLSVPGCTVLLLTGLLISAALLASSRSEAGIQAHEHRIPLQHQLLAVAPDPPSLPPSEAADPDLLLPAGAADDNDSQTVCAGEQSPSPFELWAVWRVESDEDNQSAQSLHLQAVEAAADGCGASWSGSASPAGRVHSLNWADLDSDSCPDLVVALRDSRQQEDEAVQPLQYAVLSNGCGREAGMRQLSGAAVGLSTLQGSASAATLLLDVNADAALDLCQHHCSAAAGTDCSCSLQCALNAFNASLPSSPPRFTPLTATVRSGSLSTPELPLSSALIALDVDQNGLVDLLLSSSCALGGLLSSATFKVAHSNAPSGQHEGCVRAWTADSQAEGAAAGKEEGATAAGCVMISRQAVAAAAKTDASGNAASCLFFLLAELNADGAVTLLCFGSLFPSELRILTRKGKVQRFTDTTKLQRPRIVSSSAQAEEEQSELEVTAACLSDYNGDARPDYVLATKDGSRLQLALSQRARFTYSMTTLPLPAGDAATAALRADRVLAVACFDLDNDGMSDVLALHSSGADVVPVLYYGEGDGSFHAVIVSPSRKDDAAAGLPTAADAEVSAVLAVADVDGDGWLDFAVSDSRGALAIFRNSQRPQQSLALTTAAAGEAAAAGEMSQSHWLEMSLFGRPDRRSTTLGTGIVVTVSLTDGRQLRRIMQDGGVSSGNGQAQHDARLHFGVGSDAIVPAVTASWPMHSPLRHGSVGTDQHLRLLSPWTNALLPAAVPRFHGFNWTDRGCVNPALHRLLPSFFIIGQAKCGTTSLSQALEKHPRIAPPIIKEVHFFPDMYAAAGLSYYSAFFPCGDGTRLSYEATPNYMTDRRVTPMLLSVFPSAKLIAMVRDPVTRAWSSFRFYDRLVPAHVKAASGKPQAGPDSFHARMARGLRLFNSCVRQHTPPHLNASRLAVSDPLLYEAQAACLDNSVAGGLYSVTLRRWHDRLTEPSSQLLVIAMEQLGHSVNSALQGVLEFVGLEPRRGHNAIPHTNSAPSDDPKMLPETEKMLRDFYRPFNRQLLQLFPLYANYTPPWVEYT